MRRWIWLAVALAATSCSGPAPPEAWTVERQAGGAGSTAGAICVDIETAALGEGLAEHEDLDPVLDELSRLAAVSGATAALPAFDTIRSAEDSVPDSPPIDIGPAMLAAATALDAAGWAKCSIPTFTAIYSSTGWPDCHGEVLIPVTLYIDAPDPDVQTCSAERLPAFLPCWDVTGDGYLPVDCLNGEILTVKDGEWVEAGSPRAPTPTTTTTTTTTLTTTTSTVAPTPIIEAIEKPVCTALADLFVGDDPLRGDDTDVPRMLDSTNLLGRYVGDLMSDFKLGNEDGWTLAAFQQLVIEIDDATAEECGIPLMSAAYAIVGGVEELPCWTTTGNPYPSYAPTTCEDD